MGAGFCGHVADEAPEEPFCCAPLPAQLAFGSFDSCRRGSDVRLPLALAAGGFGSGDVAANGDSGDSSEDEDEVARPALGSPAASYFQREVVERSTAPDDGWRECARGEGDANVASGAATSATASSRQGSAFRKHVFDSGTTYIGEWLNEMRHGIGEQEWTDGTSYTGQWHCDQAVGQGVFRHSNGDIYTGQWQRNVAHGLGVYRHMDQSSAYAGEFRDDLKHGLGVETWGEWARFEGQFRQGNKHGYGVYVWADGAQYSGAWHGNRMEGPGEFEGRGRLFRGCWRSSQMHGVGQSTWSDGRKYEGQYAFDQKHGFGIFMWPDGRLYEGNWHEGYQHGIGWLGMQDNQADKFAVSAVFANGQRLS